MRLTREGLKDRKAWEKAGIRLPEYNIAEVAQRTKEHPIWIHMGVGNIFRMFIAQITDQLISKGYMDRGIICISPYDHEMIGRVYQPHDNLTLAVTFETDGSMKKEVYGSIAAALTADLDDCAARNEIKRLAAVNDLQLISFTITEKGYALYGKDGALLQTVKHDMESGPETVQSAMGIVCAFLFERFLNGSSPLALVSMDNCANNGALLKNSVMTIANEWLKSGYVENDFLDYLNDESKITFPWTMIDKITPRPAESVSLALQKDGVEDMVRFVTSKDTYAAPFVNGEKAQYLVIEDSFPNGRPLLERAGVLMTDRNTVHRTERMKVTACLNPLHTALAVYGCLLGYTKISDEMKDQDLVRLIRLIGERESLPVIEKPDILSANEFLRVVLSDRLPNPMIPDTPQRIACDTSQKVGIRYGETIKSYVKRYGAADKLLGIPIAIAGWCRYLLGVDDEGDAFELSPDPLLKDLRAELSGVEVGKPGTYTGQLKHLLSNEKIFGSDLYEACIGDLIETIFLEELTGKGAVRKALKKYLNGIEV